MAFLTLPDLPRLGQACRSLPEVCDSEAAWCHLGTPLPPAAASARPCERAAILNCESLPLPTGVAALCPPASF